MIKYFFFYVSNRQFYVPIPIMFPSIYSKVKRFIPNRLLAEYIFRTFMVLVTRKSEYKLFPLKNY